MNTTFRTNHASETQFAHAGDRPFISEIDRLIHQLSSPQAKRREEAREKLVAMGPSAVKALTGALDSADEIGRWEACKALTEISDKSSVPALVRALESPQEDIRWVAAEGLVNIGTDAVEPLLVALIKRASAHTILSGAHHVLHAFSHRTFEPIFEPVLAAIEGSQPGVGVPPAAERVLSRWRLLSAGAAGGIRHPLLKTPTSRAGKRLPTPLL